MATREACSQCGALHDLDVLARASAHIEWREAALACPSCVQRSLLNALLARGEELFRGAVQRHWPLDPATAFGALPTPLRLLADPRFTGIGTTIALVDAGFTPHADLTRPINRVAAWVDAGVHPVEVREFGAHDAPEWPGSEAVQAADWHGTMTSVVAAGNGWRSDGLYPGIASGADVVLVRVLEPKGRITDAALLRAFAWIEANADRIRIRVVSLSLRGQDTMPAGPIDAAIDRLVARGITVVAAAGNDGIRELRPPATAHGAITVGGLDDRNLLDPAFAALWHSNYGRSAAGAAKPEVVAPSLWVAAPIPERGDDIATALKLFAARRDGDASVDGEIARRKLVTPYYYHADGTSVAAPIVASTVAAMLEANPALAPASIRELLVRTAAPVHGADPMRQGAGAVQPGRAVAAALDERGREHGTVPVHSPEFVAGGVRFALHDHRARQVELFGGWNSWTEPVACHDDGDGVWRSPVMPVPRSEVGYKFRIDGAAWLPDPLNAERAPDGFGGMHSIVRPSG